MKQKLTTLLLLLIAFCFSGCQEIVNPDKTSVIIISKIEPTSESIKYGKYHYTLTITSSNEPNVELYTDSIYQLGDTLTFKKK